VRGNDTDGDGREDEDGLQPALALAYRFLNRRDRTEAELRAHLDGEGIEPGDVEQAVAALRGQGYVDDARYARLLAEDKRDLEGWGSERISRTLTARGIDRELIEAALVGDEQDTITEIDRAVAVLSRRFPTPPRERRERDRALAVLLRKGYDVDLALDALTRHVGDVNA
jgi:regulatory protein